MELSAGERYTARVRHTSHQPTRPNICQQTGEQVRYGIRITITQAYRIKIKI
jgi:hypothetical protein